MNAQPSLSIVLTVYNMGECLAPCLDDIAAQTFTDYELICVDDGSTDGSADVLDAFAASHGNVRVIRQRNSGPATARRLCPFQTRKRRRPRRPRRRAR